MGPEKDNRRQLQVLGCREERLKSTERKTPRSASINSVFFQLLPNGIYIDKYTSIFSLPVSHMHHIKPENVILPAFSLAQVYV